VDAHKDFFFGDPGLDLPKEAKDVLDDTLDEHGHLDTRIDLLGDAKATAPVAAVLSGSVYETGGRTVTRTLKRTVWPAEALVGVRPLFDAKDGANANGRAGFELIRSNAKGEALAGDKLKPQRLRELVHLLHGIDVVEVRNMPVALAQHVRLEERFAGLPGVQIGHVELHAFIGRLVAASGSVLCSGAAQAAVFSGDEDSVHAVHQAALRRFSRSS